MEKRALIGLRDEANNKAYSLVAKERGYKVVSTTDPEEFLKKLQEGKFPRVLGEANRKGHSENAELARQAYEAVKKDVEGGSTKFTALTSTASVVSALNREGVPVDFTNDFQNKVDQFFD